MRKSPSKRRQLLRNKEGKPEATPQQASPTDQPSSGAKDSQEQTGKIKRLSEIVGLVQSTLTSIGIVLAGAWFITQSEFSHKANIAHSITHREIHKDWIWIHASVEIANVGKRRLALRHGAVKLYQITPLDINIIDKIEEGKPLINRDTMRAEWPLLMYENPLINNIIYPGETDKIYYEFAVPSFIKTVELYTYFSEAKDNQQGWSKVTIYDLETKKGESSAPQD